MRDVLRYSICLIAAAAGLTAADPAWLNKPAGLWTEEDIQQVLSASPWVKDVRAVVTRRLTEEELRTGGQMGQPVGVGN